MENTSFNQEANNIDKNILLTKESFAGIENTKNKADSDNMSLTSSLNLIQNQNQPVQISLKNNFNSIFPIKRIHETFNESSLKISKSKNVADNKNFTNSISFVEKKKKGECIKEEKNSYYSYIKDFKNTQQLSKLKKTKADTENKGKINYYCITIQWKHLILNFHIN